MWLKNQLAITDEWEKWEETARHWPKEKKTDKQSHRRYLRRFVQRGEAVM